jgi:hypothetical protein
MLGNLGLKAVLPRTTNNQVRECSPLARCMCALLCLVADTLAMDLPACAYLVAVANLHLSPCLCRASVIFYIYHCILSLVFVPNCVITRVIKPRPTATLHLCVHVRPHGDRVFNAPGDLRLGGPCFCPNSPSPPSPTHLPSTPLPPAPPSLSRPTSGPCPPCPRSTAFLPDLPPGFHPQRIMQVPPLADGAVENRYRRVQCHCGPSGFGGGGQATGESGLAALSGGGACGCPPPPVAPTSKDPIHPAIAAGCASSDVACMFACLVASLLWTSV